MAEGSKLAVHQTAQNDQRVWEAAHGARPSQRALRHPVRHMLAKRVRGWRGIRVGRHFRFRERASGRAAGERDQQRPLKQGERQRVGRRGLQHGLRRRVHLRPPAVSPAARPPQAQLLLQDGLGSQVVQPSRPALAKRSASQSLRWQQQSGVWGGCLHRPEASHQRRYVKRNSSISHSSVLRLTAKDSSFSVNLRSVIDARKKKLQCQRV